MKSISLQTDIQGLTTALSKLKAIDSQIIMIFSSGYILEQTDAVAIIRKNLPQARLIGCSTSGEIGSVVKDETITLMGLHFDNTKFEFTAVPLDRIEHSYQAGCAAAKNLLKDDLKAIFVLTPGLEINGSELTSGFKDTLPPHIYVSGGLAGDGVNFKKTYVVLDDGVSDKQVVAFGLYGENIHVGSASNGGWKPFGPLRRVTKSNKNVLFELDGKPALALYKEYLGDKVAGLPGSGLLYPFAIMEGKDKDIDQKGLIRTILGIDEAANSLILAGNMEAGSIVSLMHANTEELAEGARKTAVDVLMGEAPKDNSAVICVSCVGRKILMGEDTEEEIDALKELFKDTAMAGFYSYGEICHHEGTNQAELHNQTMTITYIYENAA